MIITTDELIKEDNKNSFMSHIIFETINHEVFKTNRYMEDKQVEIKLTMNGFECDFEKTIKHIESQLDKMIEKEAIKIIEKKFDEKVLDNLNDISALTEELKERINEKIQTDFKYNW